MAVEITFNDNLDQILHLFESAKSKALLNIGVIVQDDASLNSPVRTGALRDSWSVEVNEDESYVKIGVLEGALDGDYAKYVETGTSRQNARHMLRNAVMTNTANIKNITETEFHNA